VKRTAAILAAAALLLLTACSRAIAPEPLPLDRFTCARCGMMISEITDAAEYVSRGEETLFYDDLGCAASDAEHVRSGGTLFVRANAGTQWVEAGSSFFARTSDRTPMGYGFHAFATEAQARARDAQGRALRWNDLKGAK
jgi:hypothetical protein